jgi:hypothetical protein
MEENNKQKKEKKEKPSSLIITELFLVKSGWDRTFMAEIVRDKTEDGNTINRGKVVVNEGQMWSTGETQDELSNNLDDLCTMKLDMGLHNEPGISTEIACSNFYFN